MTESAAPRRFSDAHHPYSAVRIAGGIAFLSGQLGVKSGDIVTGGIVAETQQCFANLESALRSIELDFTDLVKITVYLSKMSDRLPMDDVYMATLPHPLPARTCIAVGELPFGALIELDAIAGMR